VGIPLGRSEVSPQFFRRATWTITGRIALDQPLLFREDGCDLFHCGRMFPKSLGDERAPSGRELDPAHAPVIGVLPLHQLFPLQPIDGDADRARRQLFDDPVPPASPGRAPYANEVVKRWTAEIAAADGFVFVTPEYNYGPSAVLTILQSWNGLPGLRLLRAGAGLGSQDWDLTEHIGRSLRLIYESPI
jgi:hypothetical protein